VAKLRGGTQNVIGILGNGYLVGEYSNSAFGVISLPDNVQLVDAQSGPGTQVIGVSNAGTFYSSSLSYSTVNEQNVLSNSTWVPGVQTISASDSDLPLTEPKADSYLAFGSGRLGYISGGYGYSGSCDLNNSQITRVISAGQFGSAYNPDQIYVGTLNATIGTNAAQGISPGVLLAATAGTPVVIRARDLRTQCFGNKVTISADTAGNGTFTPVPLSNEYGTYSYIVPATVPDSGRRAVSIRITAISGLSLTFAVNLGSFAKTDSANIVPRTQPLFTNDYLGLAVGSDGNAYGWSFNKVFNLMLNPSPPFSASTPTKVILPGSPQIADVVGGFRDNNFGVLIADVAGNVYSWGNIVTADMPITTAATGSTPTSPTPVPGLAGVKIKRLAASRDGRVAAALSSTGTVYLWHSGHRTPTPISALAGLDIVNIHIDNNALYALTSAGDLYTSGGSGTSGWQENICAQGPFTNLDDVSQSCFPMRKVAIGDPVKNFAPSFDGSLNNGVTAVTTTGKLFYWGYFNGAFISTPKQIAMPNSLIPALTTNGRNWSGAVQVITTTGTWLSLTALADNSPTLVSSVDLFKTGNIQLFPGDGSQLIGVNGVSEGDGVGVTLANKRVVIGTYDPSGNCSNESSWLRQVMSDGQFGSIYHADSVNVYATGNNPFRPNVSSPITLTASSTCKGGVGISFDHQLPGETVLSGNTAGTTSLDQASSTAVFNFTPTKNGVNMLTFRATTADGFTGTYSFEADVVPAPPAGRLIGVSINDGARYTNSKNVNINMVWPDGTLVAYVSNDGGFFPGTYSKVDLQNEVPWVLPDQAVIPLPAIVYARFGDSNALTYFDDIIMDSNPPILTYASATPNS
jgi:hypothetical protein